MFIKLNTIYAKEELNYSVIIEPSKQDKKINISFKEDVFENYRDKIKTLSAEKRGLALNDDMQEFLLLGDSFLADQINNKKRFYFLVDTLAFWVDKESILAHKPVSLIMKSKETTASITFFKDNNAEFIYSHPYVGEKIKKFKIKPKDIKNDRGVFLTFSWDYRKYKPTIYKRDLEDVLK